MHCRIAIIIPVHNSLGYTQRCLNGLLPMTAEAATRGWKFDVVVVDDGSTDGTTGWIIENHPEVHLIPGDGNLWWSGAIKKGMQYALHALKADYVLWWNNDIYPAEDYVERLKTLIDLNDRNTVYGSKIYQAEAPDTIWAYGGFFHRRWGHSYMLGMGEKDGEKFSKPMEADWLPGMGTLISKEVILKTGEVNDRDFPQYHGDVDYICRARLAGFSVVVDPSLRIWNHTTHSGHVKAGHESGRFSTLRNIRSQHHFCKEWLLYRKYARNPLAYMLLLKKYVGIFLSSLRRYSVR